MSSPAPEVVVVGNAGVDTNVFLLRGTSDGLVSRERLEELCSTSRS